MHCTRAHEKLERFLDNLDIPVIGHLRDTQHYVRAAEEGLGVHELGEASARQDRDAWAQILDWLQQQEQPVDELPGTVTPIAVPAGR